MADKIQLFITCNHGFEEVLKAELAELGFQDVALGYRGLYVFVTKFEDIYKINYGTRIGGRVLLMLKKFRCREQKDLYNNVRDINWRVFFPNTRITFAIDANVQHPKFKNSLFAAQLTKDAICDQLRDIYGTRPSIDVQNPDIQLNLFIHDYMATVSFDTSGAPLFKRGYRQETGQAPIQESLAAGLLRLAGYQGTEMFCDPCCGSGTFLIEAAMMASKTPPGFFRQTWGFTRHPDYRAEEWLRIKNEADDARVPLEGKRFFGVEINKNAARSAKLNLKAAGFAPYVEVWQGDFREIKLPVKPSFVMTNPPHGIRLDDVESLRPLYRALGDFLKRETQKPSRGFIFVGQFELTKEVGLAAKRRYPIYNNGIESRLMEFDLY